MEIFLSAWPVTGEGYLPSPDLCIGAEVFASLERLEHSAAARASSATGQL